MTRILLFSLWLISCEGQSDITSEKEKKVCIQMIVCGKDGNYYPTPCDAEEKGVEIDFTNEACRKKTETEKNGSSAK